MSNQTLTADQYEYLVRQRDAEIATLRAENERLTSLLDRVVEEAEYLRNEAGRCQTRDGWEPYQQAPCVLEAQKFLRGEGE